MLKNYLKVALRAFRNDRWSALINLFGLALGIACCILVYLFIEDELSYDRFHDNREHLYRVTLHSKKPNGTRELSAGQPLPLAPTLKTSLAEVTAATRLTTTKATVRRAGEDAIQETVSFADPDLLTMFRFPLLHGDAASALKDKNKAVLSEQAARKLFGEPALAMGEAISINMGSEEIEFVVSGVAATIPQNSSILFDILLPYSNSPGYDDLQTSWTSWAATTFILLDESITAETMQPKLDAFLNEYYQAMVRTWRILGWITEDKDALRLGLQPLTDIHLNPDVANELFVTSSPTNSYVLFGIGLAVLMIACINFVTLSIGRATVRTREIGMRKTLGANRSQLMGQFLGEAVLMSIVALLLGIALAEASLPLFNELANKTLTIDYLHTWRVYLVFAGIIILTGLSTGLYPALVLSAFRPSESLRKQVSLSARSRLGRALVVAQFAISVILLISALLMRDQLDFLKRSARGLHEEQVLAIPTYTSDGSGEALLRRAAERLLERGTIVAVTGNSDGFNKFPGWRSFGSRDGENWKVNVMRIDERFIHAFGIEVLGGRNFHSGESDAAHSVIVNEALVRQFGWENPVGRRFENFTLGKLSAPTVIGVVNDFNYASLHQKVEPLVLHMDSESDIRFIFVRIAPGSIPESLEQIKTTWSDIAPGKPFDYTFLDDDFDQQYRDEERWSSIVSTGTSFAIITACIGLFGLASLAVAKRAKEIGIRKVLGASALQMTGKLSLEFLKLIFVANLLAWPVAWFLMHRWLQDFAYRVDASVSIYLVAGAITSIVALSTIGVKTLRAATANPVETLRQEL